MYKWSLSHVFVFQTLLCSLHPSQWFQLVARAIFLPRLHFAVCVFCRSCAWCVWTGEAGTWKLLGSVVYAHSKVYWILSDKWAQVMTLRVSFHVEADMWPHNQPLFPAPLGLKLHPQAAAKPHASSVTHHLVERLGVPAMNHCGWYNSRVTYFYLLSDLSVYIFLTSLIKLKKTA